MTNKEEIYSHAKMLAHLANLIAIRQYAVMAKDFPTIDRQTSNNLNVIYSQLDKKIISLLLDDNFTKITIV
jgi:predicted transcriptional regulator